MDLATIGSIASVIGIILAAAIAFYQHSEMKAAKIAAKQERERASSLEDHLSRQRWQQLKSLGEQIDAIEQDGGHKYNPMSAALHARLREQYSGLLGVVATSTPNFSVKNLRHWVTVGRLPRPWQLAEAISHLENTGESDHETEDQRWLADLLKSTAAVPKMQSVRSPIEMDKYIASFILISQSVRADLTNLLSKGGQSERSATVLLHHLALDCETIVGNVPGKPLRFKAWGTGQGKSFVERFNHYQELDFWVMVTASDYVRTRLNHFRSFFEAGDVLNASLLPTSKSVDIARSRFPEIAEAAATIFQPRRE